MPQPLLEPSSLVTAGQAATTLLALDSVLCYENKSNKGGQMTKEINLGDYLLVRQHGLMTQIRFSTQLKFSLIT
jgi:hypothetical protein